MARSRIPEREKLAKALKALHEIIGSDKGVIQGSKLRPVHRSLLVEKGILCEIIKGWYYVTDPTSEKGDSTPFVANFWEYLASYLETRFGKEGYCLVAEDSLLRLTENNVIPKQVNIFHTRNLTQDQDLPFGYRLLMYPGRSSFPPLNETVILSGIRCMSNAYCLVHLYPRSYTSNASDIQLLMNQIIDPADISRFWESNATGVGRAVGALRAVGRAKMADAIKDQLARVKRQIKETNPFEKQGTFTLEGEGKSPLYSRIKLLWAQKRDDVLQFAPPKSSSSQQDYSDQLERIKADDAYHSLSIERYRVTPEFIDKVARGEWDPTGSHKDATQINAMAARGYLDAFKLVEEDAIKAYAGESAAELYDARHQQWYQALFGPSITAGILTLSDLMGYRRHMVYLKGSYHSPPHYDYVRDGMEALVECLRGESNPFVQAVLGHWLFAYIHPYMDGNGRLARFIMNLLLASGHYPWTIIRIEHREIYMQTLELASVENDITPFAKFIAEQIESAQIAVV